MTALLLAGCSGPPSDNQSRLDGLYPQGRPRRAAELRVEIERVYAETRQLEAELPVVEERRAQIARLHEEIAGLHGLLDELKARRQR